MQSYLYASHKDDEDEEYPHLSSEHCGHFLDRDQIQVDDAHRQQPSTCRGEGEGVITRGTAEWLSNRYTGLCHWGLSYKEIQDSRRMQGDNTDEAREVAVEGSGDLFITEQLWGRRRGGRESEDTSKAMVQRVWRAEWKKGQQASRGEEEEEPCWLAWL